MNAGQLSEAQFGLRQGHSTLHTKHHICDTVNMCFQRSETRLTVFIDFRKAFNAVDFMILIKQLKYFAMKGACFDIFVYSRSIQFVLNGVLSNASPFELNGGVSQGSDLAPLHLVYYDTGL